MPGFRQHVEGVAPFLAASLFMQSGQSECRLQASHCPAVAVESNACLGLAKGAARRWTKIATWLPLTTLVASLKLLTGCHSFVASSCRLTVRPERSRFLPRPFPKQPLPTAELGGCASKLLQEFDSHVLQERPVSMLGLDC